MTDIPEDIRAAAIAVVDRGYNVGLIDAVCEALMAEREAQRERDAKIAEGMPWHIPMSPDHIRGLKGSDVAAAIRAEAEKRYREFVDRCNRITDRDIEENERRIRSPETPTPQEER